MATDLALCSSNKLDVTAPQTLEQIAARLDALRTDLLNQPLVSIDDCRRFIAAVEADEDRKPTRHEAAMLGKRLVGAFGMVKVDDRDAYVAAIIQTFAAFPLSICERAVDPVTGYPGRHRFAPNSPADLITYMNGIQTARRGLCAKAQWCLRESERRERERQERERLPSLERRREMVKSFRKMLQAKGGGDGQQGSVPGDKTNLAPAAPDPGPYLD